MNSEPGTVQSGVLQNDGRGDASDFINPSCFDSTHFIPGTRTLTQIHIKLNRDISVIMPYFGGFQRGAIA